MYIITTSNPERPVAALNAPVVKLGKHKRLKIVRLGLLVRFQSGVQKNRKGL
jgi:hypothetical protein